MKLTVIFLDKNKNWKKVVMSGTNGRINSYVWKNDVIETVKDVPDVSEYISMKKFFTKTHLDMILAEKEKLFKRIMSYIQPYDYFWVWIHKNSNL